MLTWNFPAPPLSEVIDLSDRAQVLAKIDELKLTFTVHHDEIQAKVADTAAPRLLAAPAPVPAAPPADAINGTRAIANAIDGSSGNGDRRIVIVDV